MGRKEVVRRSRVLIALLSFLLGLGVSGSPSFADPFDDLACNGYDQEDGTAQSDILYGSATTRDTIRAYAGADDVYGLACGDFLYGGGDYDSVRGQHGNDYIDLGDGHDCFFSCPQNLYRFAGAEGGPGNDDIYGGEGNDDLVDKDDAEGITDYDGLHGQGGNDVVDVWDGDTADYADGGTGNDDCDADHQVEMNSYCESQQVFP